MLLESVVIGSTIESANFALTNGHFFINVREYMQPFYGNLDKWSRAILELGFSGKLLSYDECPKIRIQDNSLRVISDSRLYKYSFEVCYILDPTRVTHENKIIETNEKTLTDNGFSIKKQKFLLKKLKIKHFLKRLFRL